MNTIPSYIKRYAIHLGFIILLSAGYIIGSYYIINGNDFRYYWNELFVAYGAIAFTVLSILTTLLFDIAWDITQYIIEQKRKLTFLIVLEGLVIFAFYQAGAGIIKTTYAEIFASGGSTGQWYIMEHKEIFVALAVICWIMVFWINNEWFFNHDSLLASITQISKMGKKIFLPLICLYFILPLGSAVGTIRWLPYVILAVILILGTIYHFRDKQVTDQIMKFNSEDAEWDIVINDNRKRGTNILYQVFQSRPQILDNLKNDYNIFPSSYHLNHSDSRTIDVNMYMDLFNRDIKSPSCKLYNGQPYYMLYVSNNKEKLPSVTEKPGYGFSIHKLLIPSHKQETSALFEQIQWLAERSFYRDEAENIFKKYPSVFGASGEFSMQSDILHIMQYYMTELDSFLVLTEIVQDVEIFQHLFALLALAECELSTNDVIHSDQIEKLKKADFANWGYLLKHYIDIILNTHNTSCLCAMNELLPEYIMTDIVFVCETYAVPFDHVQKSSITVLQSFELLKDVRNKTPNRGHGAVASTYRVSNEIVLAMLQYLCYLSELLLNLSNKKVETILIEQGWIKRINNHNEYAFQYNSKQSSLTFNNYHR